MNANDVTLLEQARGHIIQAGILVRQHQTGPMFNSEDAAVWAILGTLRCAEIVLVDMNTTHERVKART